MTAQANAPIIIKRKKVIAAGGHHGGAWKVAYADFVTAMMAFFMLMWLLNATTEQQRKGLADYFAPSVPISRTSGGGNGMFGGMDVYIQDRLVEDGTGASGVVPVDADVAGDVGASAGPAAAEVAALREVEDILLGRGGESMLSEQAMRHVITRLTDEGLIIEIFALPDAPLFDGDSATPQPVTRDLVEMVARIAGLVTNPVAVATHTATRPVVLADNPVWDLSADRAGATRRMLETGGLDAARLQRLTGHADRSPVVENRLDVRNDRIEITLLRQVR